MAFRQPFMSTCQNNSSAESRMTIPQNVEFFIRIIIIIHKDESKKQVEIFVPSSSTFEPKIVIELDITFFIKGAYRQVVAEMQKLTLVRAVFYSVFLPSRLCGLCSTNSLSNNPAYNAGIKLASSGDPSIPSAVL